MMIWINFINRARLRLSIGLDFLDQCAGACTVQICKARDTKTIASMGEDCPCHNFAQRFFLDMRLAQLDAHWPNLEEENISAQMNDQNIELSSIY